MAHKFETGFFGNSQPAWHGLGTVIEGTLTSAEALKVAGLDWEVEKRPVYVQAGGQMEPVEDRFAVVRKTDDRVFGIVSDRFQEAQNHEEFAFLDSLLGEGVRYETAGSLKGGAQIWMLAVMPEDIIVAGDVIKNYCFLSSGHDGRTSRYISPTPTRVVCWNTLSGAISDARAAQTLWSGRHMGSLEDQQEDAKRFFNFMLANKEQVEEDAERLLSILVDEKRASGILKKLYPVKEGQSDLLNDRAKESRSLVYRALKAEDLENFRNTGWGFLNALADVTSHEHLQPGKKDSWKENKMLKVVKGHKDLKTARKLVLSLA